MIALWYLLSFIMLCVCVFMLYNMFKPAIKELIGIFQDNRRFKRLMRELEREAKKRKRNDHENN